MGLSACSFSPSLLGDGDATTCNPLLGARFLTRDPLEPHTRSAYGYVHNNPINRIDPTGLSDCGQLSLGGFVDCASKADDAARGARDTVELTGDFAVWGATNAMGSAVNGANEHFGISGMACLYYCIGLEYQNGHFYLNYGQGPIIGATVSPNYYSNSLDEWCGTTEDTTVGVYKAGVTVDDSSNWSVVSCASSVGPPERQWHGTISSGYQRRRRDDRGVGVEGSSAPSAALVTVGFWRWR
jgi:hypothetical protein